MTRTLIFDLGNVIVPFDFGRAYDAIERLSGLSREQIRSHLTEGGFVRSYESGLIGTEEFVAEANRRLGTEIAMGRFREIWVSIFEPRTLIPETLIGSLAGRYRLIALSNTNEMHYRWVEQNYPVLGHFHHHVLSHQVKAVKPEDAIYREALARADGEPGECFYTDDIPQYVEGGRRHGMDAVEFTGFEDLLSQLRARGVEA